MPDIPRGNRPLSPFMLGSHYRLQWTTFTSLLNRITGNALIVGVVLIVWWLLAASIGPEAFAWADWFLRSWFGDLVLLGSLWALWYHMLMGIRHLVWFAGWTMEIHKAEQSGQILFGLAFVLTALTVLILWLP